jgi:hypothetical protein
MPATSTICSSFDSRQRAALQSHLTERGIETLVHYPIPIPRQAAFAASPPADCPIASAACDQVVSLPFHPALPAADLSAVAGAIHDFRGKLTVRALITGGAGFIGSHLSGALLDAGHQVLILDNLSTGSIENITHLKGRPGFDYHIDSVNNEPLLAELIDRADVVFHFAARGRREADRRAARAHDRNQRPRH